MRWWPGRVSGLAAAVAGAVILTAAACAAPRPVPARTGAAPEPPAPAVPLTTSLATAAGSWAVVPVSSRPVFWQVLVRPGTAGTWRLDTPPGAASNGGLVAAAEPDGAGGLTVAFRPTQDLTFTPLAATAPGGTAWTAAPPLRARITASPDALAVSGRVMAAVAGSGAVEASTDGGTTWRTLPGPAPRACGAVRITSLSVTGPTGLLAGGACGPGGTAVLLSGALAGPSAGWRTVSLPVPGRLVRLAGRRALVRAPGGLVVLREARAAGRGVPRWSASAPLPVTGTPVASGWLGSSGAWALLPGGGAAVITGSRTAWRTLPRVPARTAALASGPGGSADALAVSGPDVVVWRNGPSASRWTRVQTVRVPVQYGSSG